MSRKLGSYQVFGKYRRHKWFFLDIITFKCKFAFLIVIDKGYEQAQAILVGCMAHARRKFVEVKKAQGKKGNGKADWALDHLQKLYRIETQIKDKSIDER